MSDKLPARACRRWDHRVAITEPGSGPDLVHLAAKCRAYQVRHPCACTTPCRLRQPRVFLLRLVQLAGQSQQSSSSHECCHSGLDLHQLQLQPTLRMHGASCICTPGSRKLMGKLLIDTRAFIDDVCKRGHALHGARHSVCDFSGAAVVQLRRHKGRRGAQHDRPIVRIRRG